MVVGNIVWMEITTPDGNVRMEVIGEIPVIDLTAEVIDLTADSDGDSDIPMSDPVPTGVDGVASDSEEDDAPPLRFPPIHPFRVCPPAPRKRLAPPVPSFRWPDREQLQVRRIGQEWKSDEFIAMFVNKEETELHRKTRREPSPEF